MFYRMVQLMKTYLILDNDNKAMNMIVLDVPEFGTVVEYNGPFWSNTNWDGEKLTNPNEIINEGN